MASLNTKNTNSFSSTKYWHRSFAVVFLIVAGLVLFYVFAAPRSSAHYYTKVLDKIGAPSGFTTSVNDIRSGGIGESPYASRTYTGTGTEVSIKENMLTRVKDAGFTNAIWRDESSSNAAGIHASCDAATVGVYINEVGSKHSIQVEVYEDTNTYFASNCPILL